MPGAPGSVSLPEEVVPLGETVAVAFSGGRDSLALLHATVQAAAALNLHVVALHVHHGLMAEADAWVRSATRLCGRWQRAGWPVRLRWHRLEGRPAKGDSVEAWARRERYATLARMAREEGASLVLLAQHRRDQAETVLLQALRGAGPRGLAAMPRIAERGGLLWARPWLDQPREAIEAYVRRYRLKPVDDPSNADPRFARSRLRVQLWPVLHKSFPAAESALVQLARRAQEADAALAELAATDLASVADAAGLHRAPWQLLSTARRTNALRCWLAAQLGSGAPDALVQRLLVEWPQQSHGRWPVAGRQEFRSYRGVLRLAEASVRLAVPANDRGSEVMDLSQPGRTELPQWGGCWLIEVCDHGGIAQQALQRAELRMRRGGEQFQRAANTPPRSLKKQYQLAALPTDQRRGPLLWLEGELAYVPGLGIDARAVAAPGVAQCRLRWVEQGGEGPTPG